MLSKEGWGGEKKGKRRGAGRGVKVPAARMALQKMENIYQ